MKRLSFLLATVVLSATSAFSQIEFSGLVHDFGNIRELDGPVSHDFEFTNTGTRPYVIDFISVSCGCTTPEYDKAPVMPGRSGKITITYDPAGRPGVFDREIVVTGNNRRDRTTLRITGTVAGKPRTVEDDFPVDLGGGMRSTSTTFLFGYLARGKKVTQSVNVVNNGDSPAELDFRVMGGYSDHVSITARPGKVLPAHERGTVDFTYDMTSADVWGLLNTVFRVTVNGRPAPESFNAYATVVEDFSKLTDEQLRNAPRADFSARFFHFGDVRGGEKLTHEFTITNSGRSPLYIRNINPNSASITYTVDKMTIGVGETATIKATLDTSGKTGRVSDSISLVVNDRENPLKEIRLMAVVTE